MARHSVGARSAGAGSTTLPVGSLYGHATAEPRLRECGIFNTTATAVALALRRLTATGTQGTGLTEAKHGKTAPLASAFDTHTANPTLGDDLGYRVVLGASIGSGIVWTFGDEGIIIPVGVGNGIGIIVATGTGQILDWYMVWDE